MARATPYSLSVGQLVSRSIALYVGNLLPFTLLGAVFLLPWIALHVYDHPMLEQAARTPPRRGEAPPIGPAFLPLAELILQSLLSYLLTGAVTYGVVQQLRGQPAGMAQAISKGLSSFGRTFATGLLCSLRIFLFTLLIIIPGIIQQVRLYVAIPVAVMEGKGAADAVARSRTLTDGSGWQIFGSWLLIFAIGFGLGIVGFFLMHGAGSGAERTPVWFDIAVELIVGPFAATMMATAYFLLRQGKENVDPKDIAAVFD
jgi:uncharacterized membrane protein